LWRKRPIILQTKGDGMKKTVCLILAFLVLFLVSTVPSNAYGKVLLRGGVWIGPGWGGWGPWWWGPPYYPYPYYPYEPNPPVVIQQQPPTYVEPTPQPEKEYYWYFCQKPQGYYPYVKKCPGGWLKVIPQTPPDEKE
jgi:hypothetical protein